MLTLTIIGLFIATLVSVFSLILDKGKNVNLKIVLTILILAGFGIAIINALTGGEKEKELLKKEKLLAQKNEELSQQKNEGVTDHFVVLVGYDAELREINGNQERGVTAL